MSTIQEELDEAIAHEEFLGQTQQGRSEVIDISDSLKCHRMRYLKYYGAPSKAIDARGHRVFLMGRVIEKVLIRYLRFRGIIHKKGQYFKHYLDGRIRGKTDFTLLKDGKYFVAELKSYDGFSFWKRKKEPEKINLLHEAQALNYVDILLHGGETIEDRALIVEISRDNLNVIEEYTRPISQLREELHWDWKTLIEAIDTKSIPKVLPDFPSGKQCKWCSKRETCKELHEKENQSGLKAKTQSVNSANTDDTEQPSEEWLESLHAEDKGMVSGKVG